MRLRQAIAAFAIVGGAIASYLTYVHYAGISPICTTGGCEQVQTSKYAELGGVPVALLGLVGYVLILATTFFRGVVPSFAGALLSLVGVAFSGYLLWAQIVPIGALCQWCVGNDAVITIVAVLCVARMLTEPDAT